METGYKFLAAKRLCGPKKEAIHGATCDLAKSDPNKQESFESYLIMPLPILQTWERQLIHDCVHSLDSQLALCLHYATH
jgi:hypothetical protein